MTMKIKQSFLLFLFFASTLIDSSKEDDVGLKGTQRSYTHSYSSSSASAHASAYSSSNTFSYGNNVAELPIVGPIPISASASTGDTSRTFQSQGNAEGDAILYPDAWHQNINVKKATDYSKKETEHSNQQFIGKDKTSVPYKPSQSLNVADNSNSQNGGGYFNTEKPEIHAEPQEKLSPICCKPVFPGPDGSIFDYKVPIQNSDSPKGTSYESSTYTRTPVKTCCKGPFPGPQGSIHDFKPASAVGSEVHSYHQHTIPVQPVQTITTSSTNRGTSSHGSYDNRKSTSSIGATSPYQTQYVDPSCTNGNCQHTPPNQYLQPPFIGVKPITEHVIEKHEKPTTVISGSYLKPTTEYHSKTDGSYSGSSVITESTLGGTGYTAETYHSKITSHDDHNNNFQEKVVGLREGPQGSPFKDLKYGYNSNFQTSISSNIPSIKDDKTVFIDLEKILPDGETIIIPGKNVHKSTETPQTVIFDTRKTSRQCTSPNCGTYSNVVPSTGIQLVLETKPNSGGRLTEVHSSRPCIIPGCGTSYRTYSNAVPSTGIQLVLESKPNSERRPAEVHSSRPCAIPGCGTSYRTYSNAVPSSETQVNYETKYKVEGRPVEVVSTKSLHREHSVNFPLSGTQTYTIQIKTLPVHVSGTTYTNNGASVDKINSGFVYGYSGSTKDEKINNNLYYTGSFSSKAKTGTSTSNYESTDVADSEYQKQGTTGKENVMYSWNEGKTSSGHSSPGYGRLIPSLHSDEGVKVVALANTGSSAYSNVNAQASSSSYASSYSS